VREELADVRKLLDETERERTNLQIDKRFCDENEDLEVQVRFLILEYFKWLRTDLS
jgi:hypothetical protein